MKLNTRFYLCTIVSIFLLASNAVSQQSPQKSSPPAQGAAVSGSPGGVYTHTLFIAPNKEYGYNLFRDGRIIYHQPAMQQPAGKSQGSITTKTQADKAAFIAIEKIKRGMPAELTAEELKQVTAQQ